MPMVLHCQMLKRGLRSALDAGGEADAVRVLVAAQHFRRDDGCVQRLGPIGAVDLDVDRRIRVLRHFKALIGSFRRDCIRACQVGRCVVEGRSLGEVEYQPQVICISCKAA